MNLLRGLQRGNFCWTALCAYFSLIRKPKGKRLKKKIDFSKHRDDVLARRLRYNHGVCVCSTIYTLCCTAAAVVVGQNPADEAQSFRDAVGWRLSRRGGGPCALSHSVATR
jgi:hypothetical protein